MKLNEWVLAARKFKGWTQTQLGDSLGVTKGNISAWEVGRHAPSFEQVQRIEKLTGYPIGESEIRKPNHVGQALKTLLDAAKPATTVERLRGHLAEHNATRRRLIGSLLAQLSEDPGNEEIANELAQQLDAPPAQQTLAA